MSLTTDHGRAANFHGHGSEPESGREFVLAHVLAVCGRELWVWHAAHDELRALAG